MPEIPSSNPDKEKNPQLISDEINFGKDPLRKVSEEIKATSDEMQVELEKPAKAGSSNQEKELSPELIKKKEKLRKAKEELERLSDYDLLSQGAGATYANAINYLSETGEKGLSIDTFKIYLFDAIAHIAESIKKGTQSDMSGFGQHVWFSYKDFIEGLPVSEEIHNLGKGIGNLYVIEQELMGCYMRAAGIYEEMGNTEKADENKRKEDWGRGILHTPEGKAIWKKARQDFIDSLKNGAPFSSQGERDSALEKLIINIQQRMDVM